MRKSGPISVVQVDECALSLLRVKSDGESLEVMDHRVVYGPWDSAESRADQLKMLVAECDAQKDRIYTVLPRHEVTARLMAFPSTDPAEVEGMVRLAAQDFVPFPPDALYIAHDVLGESPSGESQALVVVAHNDAIANHVNLARQAGIVPEQVFLSTACLATALGRAGLEGNVGLGHLSPGALEVLIAKDGRLAYTRGLSTDNRWNLDDRAQSNELSLEMRGSLAAFRRDAIDDPQLKTLLVSGDDIDVDAATASLTAELDVPCATAAELLHGWVKDAETLKGMPVTALGASLLALREPGCIIDLTPSQELRRRAAAGLRMRIARIGVAVAVLLSTCGVYYWQAVSQREAYIAELQEQVDHLRPIVRDGVNKRRHLERLQRQIKKKETALELLSAFVDIAPNENINMTTFRYEYNQGIEIFGRAKSFQNVPDLAEAMRKAAGTTVPLFAQASFLYANPAQERNKRIYEFNIEVPFPEEDAGLDG